MTVPTTRRSHHSRVYPQFSTRVNRWPVVVRRVGAWAIEVSLVVASVALPYGLGAYSKSRAVETKVPLNHVLTSTEEGIAQLLAIPLGDGNRQVAPLTNLFWTGSLILPWVVVGSQLYLLAKRGQTTPKRWFGIRVVTNDGEPPGLMRAMIREPVGRWGLPLGSAYLLWRYSGAFPGLGILVGLATTLLLAESFSARFSRQRRALHDRLAGTYVVDADRVFNFHRYNNRDSTQRKPRSSVQIEMPSLRTELEDEDAAIAAIVLTPEEEPGESWQQSRKGLWLWMRQHPGLTLLLVAIAGMASVLGTFVGTQIYIQGQANHRDSQQQQNQAFLELVNQLSPESPTSISERRGAILALGTLNDPQATQLLVDLLSQEDVPELIDAVQQALVSVGPEALPHLKKLNQALQNDLASLQYTDREEVYQTQALRQRATQRAIAKILTIYSGQFHQLDLSRIDLGQTVGEPADFVLLLEQIDLSGIRLRGTILSGAHLENSQFYGPGNDQRLGTFDDWIADLSGADLKSANLEKTNLRKVSLRRANLIQAILNRADLSEANLMGANLSSAQLLDTNLQNARLEDASLTGADLSEANFSQANLHGAMLGKVSALGGQFQHANLSQTNWIGADLSGADLTQANLRQANLSATKLAGAKLHRTKLVQANLRNADLSLADLRGADLSGADFRGTIFFTLEMPHPDQFIRTTAPTSAIVKDVNFSKVRNLDPDQIRYLCQNGGLHPKCKPETKVE